MKIDVGELVAAGKPREQDSAALRNDAALLPGEQGEAHRIRIHEDERSPNMLGRRHRAQPMHDQIVALHAARDGAESRVIERGRQVERRRESGIMRRPAGDVGDHPLARIMDQTRRPETRQVGGGKLVESRSALDPPARGQRGGASREGHPRRRAAAWGRKRHGNVRESNALDPLAR